MSAFLGSAPGPLNFTPVFLTISKITCIAAELTGCVFISFFPRCIPLAPPITYPSLPVSVPHRVVNSDGDDLLLHALYVLGRDYC